MADVVADLNALADAQIIDPLVGNNVGKFDGWMVLGHDGSKWNVVGFPRTEAEAGEIAKEFVRTTMHYSHGSKGYVVVRANLEARTVGATLPWVSA